MVFIWTFSVFSWCVDTLLYRQPLETKTASKLDAGQNEVLGATENDTAAASPDQSDDTVVDPEVDNLAAARAQLRARAGARGKRSNRPGRGAGGQKQVNSDLFLKGSVCVASTGYYHSRRAKKWGKLAYV